MYIELRRMGCFVERQKRIQVYYKTEEVGYYFADLIVDGYVIL